MTSQYDAKYVYGPVTSRRLGLSLGIDLVPGKICDFDCIYCQVGLTLALTMERRPYVRADDVLTQLGRATDQVGGIDYLTLSGSGEPTLNSEIGVIIKGLKAMSRIPVAVITNGSLFFLPEVQNDLLQANVVLPTLCTARATTFARINRAHPSLTIERIIEGQVKFRELYKGKIWLEIMLIKEFNDSPDELELLRAATRRINPDKIQLNTVVRPPSNQSARPLPIEELRSIRGFFGAGCEVVAESTSGAGPAELSAQQGKILELTKRRPVTLHDIALGLGLDTSQVQTELARLLDTMQIECVEHHGVKYYRAIGKTSGDL